MAGSKTEKLAEGLKAWLQKPGNWLRLLILAAALAGLAAFAVWLGRPVPGEVPTSASQMVYEKAKSRRCFPTTRPLTMRTRRAAVWEVRSLKSVSSPESIRARS